MKKFSLYEFCQSGDAREFEMTVKQAVIAKCFDCCCYDPSEVRQCTSVKCPLHSLRDKWCPSKVYPKKELSEEQKKELSNRMKTLHKS